MTAAPETRYTRTEDGVNIAYQVMGAGTLIWRSCRGGGAT